MEALKFPVVISRMLLAENLDKQKVRLQNIIVRYAFIQAFHYTSLFLWHVFEFLGPADQLSYLSKSSDTPGKICRPRSLLQLEEFFFVLVAFDWN